MEDPRPHVLRGGLHRLSRGLIAYGIIGLAVAAIGLGATVWVNGRISDLRSEAEVTATQLATTMEIASLVLRDGSTTAKSFSVTMDQAAEAISAAGLTMTETSSDLSALAAQLRSVNILGSTPLSSHGDAVGRIAANMSGLDIRLSLIADTLRGNRDMLTANADSLSRLGDSTDAIAARLGPSLGQDALGETQQVIAITLLMFATWSFLPAVGALALGVWLRRELVRSRSA